MTTSTLERTEGMALLNKAIATIKEDIEEAGGIFNIQQQVRYKYSFVHTFIIGHLTNITWLVVVFC